MANVTPLFRIASCSVKALDMSEARMGRRLRVAKRCRVGMSKTLNA